MADIAAPSTAVSNALFVIDGKSPAPGSAATAHRLLGPDVRWSIVAVVPDHPSVTSGATGFAAPVLSPDEMDSVAAQDLIAGDAAAAETAGGFGNQPVTQTVVRGAAAVAVTRHVEHHPADLIVVDSPDLASALLERDVTAVLVVSPDPATT